MTRDQVDRLVATALAIALVVRLPDIGVDLFEGADPVPAWWRPVAAVALCGVVAAVAASAFAGRRAALAARAVVAVTVGCLVSYAVLANGTPSIGTRPWVSMLVPCAMAAAAIAWSPVPALLVGSGVALLQLMVQGSTGWPATPVHRVDQLAMALVVLVATVVGVGVAVGSADRVERARAASVAAYADAAARRAEERERHRWDSLVHDSVLSALAVTGRLSTSDGAVVAQAAALAETALEGLRGGDSVTPRTGSDLRRRLADEIAVLDPGIRLADGGGLDDVTVSGAVADAIVDSALEALRNSLAHAAGPTTRADDVTGSEGDGVGRVVMIAARAGRVLVEVVDDGVGFQPSQVSSARLGLQVSVLGRLRAVGGFASVTSAPGRGTTVRVTHPDPRPDGSAVGPAPRALDETSDEPPGRLRLAALLIAVLWVGLHVSIALLHLSDTRAPMLDLLALGAVAGLSAWGLSPLVTGRRAMSSVGAWVYAVGAGLFPLLVCPFVVPGEVLDVASWTPGMLGLLAAVLVLRDRLAPAVLVTVLGTAVIVASYLFASTRHGSGLLASAVLTCALPAAWLAASWGCRTLATRTGATIAGYWAAEAEARVQEASARGATRLAEARRAELVEVARPLLQRIAAQRDLLDAAFRARCRAVEQQLRDDLMARALIDPRVRGSVRAARRRGVVVSLRDDRPVDSVGTSDAGGTWGTGGTGGRGGTGGTGGTDGTDGTGQPAPAGRVRVPERARTFVSRAIDQVDVGAVTVRVPPTGAQLTFVVVEPGRAAATAETKAALGNAVARNADSTTPRLAGRLTSLAERLGLEVDVDEGDGDLLAVLTAPWAQPFADSSS